MSDSQSPIPTPTAQVRQWAMFCHLAAFLGLVLPFGNLIGPLILWQMKKETDPFIDAQGKEALNFQITASLAIAVSIMLIVVIIGFPLLLLIGIGATVLTIIAAIKANDGLSYRYPFCWRPVK